MSNDKKTRALGAHLYFVKTINNVYLPNSGFTTVFLNHGGFTGLKTPGQLTADEFEWLKENRKENNNNFILHVFDGENNEVFE